MPYLLLQMILAYEQSPALDNYTAFVITLEEPAAQFITATCSVSYIHGLINARMPRTSLGLKISLSYKLQPEDRWEFMKVYYGLLQYLYARLKIWSQTGFYHRDSFQTIVRPVSSEA